jgi:hypothetical protein
VKAVTAQSVATANVCANARYTALTTAQIIPNATLTPVGTSMKKRG